MLLVAFLSACSEVINLQGGKEESSITLTVFNSPMTKAEESEIDWESHLTRLDIFFYEKGNTSRCVYYDYIDDPAELASSSKITLHLVKEQIFEIFNGKEVCEVFIIANLPEAVYSRINAEQNPLSTDYSTLSAIALDFNGNYNKSGCDFIMAGYDGSVTKGPDDNASGTVKLFRNVSKITLKINVPEKIVLQNGDEMVPVLTQKVVDPNTHEESTAATPLTAMHNAVSQGVVYPIGVVDQDMSVIPDGWYFDTDENKTGYNQKITETTGSDGVKKYQLTCTAPFYSYPNVWERGSEHAAYLTLEMPWKNTTTGRVDKYYYQILINGQGRSLDPNSWYDMTVNVGVIGSSVESHPETLKDITFFVLDWTDEPKHTGSDEGDTYEDVEIKDYTYLIVPEKHLVINNATSGVINFSASHDVKVALNRELRPIPDMPDLGEVEHAAFYVDCSSDPTPEELLDITPQNNFSIDNSSGKLTFTYNYRDKSIYSPIYVYATVWLELDGEDSMSEIEKGFSEEISIVQYPPIYIIPYESIPRSIYVNNYRATGTQNNASGSQVKINNKYWLGSAPGTDNNNKYMHVITVTSLDGQAFPVSTLDETGENIKYIIGDPRQRECDINLNPDEYDMSESNKRNQGWAWGNDSGGDPVYGKLDHYYPTSTEDDAYRIIAPKFRVSSRLGGYSAGNPVGVAMRCASYQENGYPAGRWRLPTTAEILFMIYLAQEEAILPLFQGNSWYMSSTHVVQYVRGSTIVNVKKIEGNPSVRCVYDEWYWGSNKDAEVKDGTAEDDADHYYFTWGDEEIWPCDKHEEDEN